MLLKCKCTYSTGTTLCFMSSTFQIFMPVMTRHWTRSLKPFFIWKCLNILLLVTRHTSDVSNFLKHRCLENFHVFLLLFHIIHTISLLCSFRLSYFKIHSSLSYSVVPESLKHSRSCENHEYKKEILFGMWRSVKKRFVYFEFGAINDFSFYSCCCSSTYCIADKNVSHLYSNLSLDDLVVLPLFLSFILCHFSPYIIFRVHVVLYHRICITVGKTQIKALDKNDKFYECSKAWCIWFPWVTNHEHISST